MTVTAPPLDPAGAAIDAEIATVQALVDAVTQQIIGTAALTADNMNYTADSPATADAIVGNITATVAANSAARYSYQQLLNQLQVEAIDHYMVTGWLNAAAILTQYAPPPAWDERGQELQAHVTYLTALVANAPPPPPGNPIGYGGSGWVTVLQNYQQQLYEAQIALVEHMIDFPGGTTAATILANMSGTQSFAFEYTSSGALPSFPSLPPITPPAPPPPPPTTTHTVGGVLTGLAPGNSITLQLNGASDLTLTGNGAFVFATRLLTGADYSVTVSAPPVGQVPTVLSGSGVIPGADVGNVQVIAAPSTLHAVGGTLSGLIGAVPVVLQNNGGDNIAVGSNGTFVFPTLVANGQPYHVTVLSGPVNQNITVNNGSGTVNGADITNVAVNCAVPASYFVGGTLSNLLAGQTITLQNNAGDDLTLSANGTFQFATKVAAGTIYAVTVSVPPVGDTCTVSNGNGTVGNQNVTNVGVNCVAPPTFTLGGTLSGLTGGASIVLQNNGGDNLTLNANGAFTFATALPQGAAYLVTVLTPPTGEQCVLAHAGGSMPQANVTNVTATCSPLPPGTRRFSPGIYVALSYAQCGMGPNGDNLSADSGAFSYAAGTAAVPLTITGNYSAGTMPGGHLGTGTDDGCSKGTGTGGHTLSRNGTGPAVNFDSTHRTVGFVPRYPWNDIETSQGVYDFTRMDADLAQCIALGIMWIPLVVFHTFGPAEASASSVTGSAPNGTPVPAYLAAFSSQGSGGQALWRWDNTNVVPHSTAFLAKIGKRYDLCANFGGVATQETSTSNADSVAHNFSTAGYLTALNAEDDAYSAASPNSRHWALQNFGGSRIPANATVPSVMIDQHAAHIQGNGAVLMGPDTTLCSNGVYGSCYTSGSGVQAGRYSGYHFGGTIGSGVNFPSTGPSGCSIQRAEWIGIGPACLAGQAVQDTLDYLLGSTTVGVQPNFLKGQVLFMDWHQGAGSPGNQQFTPDGVNLIKNNALSRFQTWSP